MAEIEMPEGWSTFSTGCATCPEGTLPTGEQELEILHCYIFDEGLPPGTLPGNSSGQMNYVTGEPGSESFVAIVASVSGFGVPYPQAGSYQVVEATGETLAPISTLVLPGSATANFVGNAAGTGRNGHSDERSVMHTLSQYDPPVGGQSTVIAYFSYDNNTVTILNMTGGEAPNTWAKRGDRFWHGCQGGVLGLQRYSLSAGGLPQATIDWSAIMPFGISTLRSLNPTDNYLYAMIRGFGPGLIYRTDLDTGAVVDSWDIVSRIEFGVSMSVVNDDLIYVWAVGEGGWRFYYFIPSTDTIVLIGTVIAGCTPSTFDQSGQQSFHFNKGYFYLTSGGEGSGTPHITKIGVLICPGLDVPIGAAA